jgi:cbb3-type cytochrome oxidase subunit 3
MKKIFFATVILFILACFFTDIWAQCPMCKMAAESDMKAGGTAGRGLNSGIFYMLSAPYLLVGGIAFLWWRNRRHQDDDSAQIAENQNFSEN